MPTAGETAPEFTAPTHAGSPLTLSSLRGHPTILYFYPEADTSGCTLESKGFRDIYGELRAKGIHVIGVSVDPVEAQAAFAGKYSLPFPLVADTSKDVARAYGVLGPSGKARRVTFLIDPKGAITEVIESRDAAAHVTRAKAALLG